MTDYHLPPPLDLAAIERDGIPEPKWIAEPYIAEGDLVVVVADGGSGKSFLALDMTIGLAQGKDVLGRQPAGARTVLYIDEDSSIPQITRRLTALAAGRETTFESLGGKVAIYSGVGFRIDEHEGRARLNMALARHRPQVLILDAFRAFHGRGEENNAEMAMLMRHVLRPLCNQFGVTVILIHHTNKESEESATKRKDARNAARATRGGTEIRNAADCLLYIERRAGKPTVYLDKTRWIEDADRPEPLNFRIRNVDEHGAVKVDIIPLERQGKVAKAKEEVLAALPRDGEMSTTELMNTLPGIAAGTYGRSTLLRGLELLGQDGAVAQRKEGKGTLWKRLVAPASSQGAASADEAVTSEEFDAAAPEA